MRTIAAYLLLCAPAFAGEPPTLATTTVELAETRIVAEVASNDAQRMRGLMFRDELAPDAGMVFVFDRELPLSFWMKNTRIPLDILYFDAAGVLVSIQRAVPPCRTAYCPSYPSEAPAKYVLELNAGRAAEIEVAPGARLCERGARLTGLPACE